jgi:hypothetical protein
MKILRLLTALAAVFLCARAAGGQDHTVQPGTEGNVVLLDIVCPAGLPVSMVKVELGRVPEWITVGRLTLEPGPAGTDSVISARVEFGVSDTVGAGRTAEMVFAVMVGGRIARRHVVALRTGTPLTFSLSQNYPNPFNPTTTIRYGLPFRSRVRLAVFNTLGQLVTTLLDGEVEAGMHAVHFDGSLLASGAYVYRFQAGEFVESRRFLLVK